MKIQTLTNNLLSKLLWLSVFTFSFLSSVHSQCDNVTGGGFISGDETGEADPTFDPEEITNIILPSGGSGNIEYLWIYTTNDPTVALSQWLPISNSNSPIYDPEPITETTYYRRCARRTGCIDYVAESNYVTKAIVSCDNVTNGGLIASSQVGMAPFSPDPLTNMAPPMGGTGEIEYLWFSSTVGPPYIQGSSDWIEIPNSNSPDFSPGILNDTTWYIRCARRVGCDEYVGKTNLITITVNPNDNGDCDNVVTGGMIGLNQQNCGEFDPQELVNTVLPSGGTGDLEYLWLSSTTTSVYIQGSAEWTEIPNSNSVNYDPPLLSQTTWFIRCVRRAGCTEYAGESNIVSIQINPIPSVSLENVQNIICADANDGAIEISINGGTEPYTFNWNDGAFTSQNLSNLSEGTYNLTVTDTNNCTTQIETAIINPNPIEVEFFAQLPDCVGGADGMINAQIIGGYPPYSCFWNTGQAGLPLINAGAGAYTLTCTDSNGCTIIEEFTLVDPEPTFFVSFITENADCTGSNTGSLVAQVEPIGNYTFLWSDSNATTTNTLDNVGAGTYFLTITDETGCSITSEGTIENNEEINLNLTQTNTSCQDVNDGTATVEVQGGTAPYSILWDDPANSNTTIVNNLAVGTYSVTVSDANGCTAEESITVGGGEGLELSFVQQNITCSNANDGFIIINPTNGTAPYAYEWTNIDSNNNTVSSLTPGNYAVTVTDANGCQGSAGFEMINPPAINLDLMTTDVLCANDLNDITSQITGGTLPYVYSWSNGSSNANLSAVAVGTYTLTVTDANNCSVSEDASINSTSDLSINITTTHLTCADANDGKIAITGLAGTAPYSYLWNTGQTSATLTDLAAGSYQATLTDAAGCSVISEITEITAPTVLDIDLQILQAISDIGAADGELTASASGGTPPIEFIWSNGETSSTINNLTAGTYSVTVTDTNGCQTSASINLPDGPNLSISIGDYVWFDENLDGIQQANENGVGGITVQLISTATGLPVATQVTNPNGFYIFENVQPGEYYVQFVLSSLPTGTILTEANIGTNDSVDSDADAQTGQTDVFTITAGQADIDNLDAGIRPKCLNVEYGGLIAENQSVCFGSAPDLIANQVSPNGGSGTLEYLWLQSTVAQYTGPGDPNWTPIPNSNSPDYQPNNLDQTTYFIRCARRECCIEYPGESNIVTISISDLPFVNMISPIESTCLNQLNNFEANAVSGNANYLWSFGEDATPATATTREVDNVQWSSTGEKTVTLSVTTGEGCSLTISTTVDVTNCINLIGQNSGFAASLIDKEKASLTWNTDTDDRGSVFFLEKSKEGNNFTTIATIQGRYNGGYNFYQYTDEDLFLGINHYRVRQLNPNGQQGISNIEWIRYLPVGSPEVRVFPNPFDQKFTVNVLLPQEEEILLQLMSPQGHILNSEIIDAQIFQQSFDLSNYPSGLYIVKIYYGLSDVVTEKIMKR